MFLIIEVSTIILYVIFYVQVVEFVVNYRIRIQMILNLIKFNLKSILLVKQIIYLLL